MQIDEEDVVNAFAMIKNFLMILFVSFIMGFVVWVPILIGLIIYFNPFALDLKYKISNLKFEKGLEFYREPHQTEQSFEKAFKHFQSSNAERDNPDALFYIGVMHATGKGTKRNLFEAQQSLSKCFYLTSLLNKDTDKNKIIALLNKDTDKDKVIAFRAKEEVDKRISEFESGANHSKTLVEFDQFLDNLAKVKGEIYQLRELSK